MAVTSANIHVLLDFIRATFSSPLWNIPDCSLYLKLFILIVEVGTPEIFNFVYSLVYPIIRIDKYCNLYLLVRLVVATESIFAKVSLIYIY